MAFPAKYSGRCAVCDGPIEIGEFVTYSDEEIVHAVCDSPFRPITSRYTEVVCPVCFLTSCDCEE